MALVFTEPVSELDAGLYICHVSYHHHTATVSIRVDASSEETQHSECSSCLYFDVNRSEGENWLFVCFISHSDIRHHLLLIGRSHNSHPDCCFVHSLVSRLILQTLCWNIVIQVSAAKVNRKWGMLPRPLTRMVFINRICSGLCRLTGTAPHWPQFSYSRDKLLFPVSVVGTDDFEVSYGCLWLQMSQKMNWSSFFLVSKPSEKSHPSNKVLLTSFSLIVLLLLYIQ